MRTRAGRRILGVVAAGVLLVWLNLIGALQPIKGGLGWLFSPFSRRLTKTGASVGNFFHVAKTAGQLAADNQRLELQLAELRQRLSDDAEIRAQNESLRRQLNFSEAEPRNLIPAEVVAYQPDNFHQYLSVGRGKKAGLKEGMAVISEGSLVGRLTDVTDTSAKVFLVIDPNFKVNALDQDTRAVGTVRGQIGTGLIMDKIAQSDTVKPGDTVITSGLGGELPKGIIIGRVEAIHQTDNAVFQTALVSSGVKFNRLELVYVVDAP